MKLLLFDVTVGIETFFLLQILVQVFFPSVFLSQTPKRTVCVGRDDHLGHYNEKLSE